MIPRTIGSKIDFNLKRDPCTLLERLEDACARSGANVRISKTETGFIDIDAQSYADWVISRSITVNEFAFDRELVRWKKPSDTREQESLETGKI